MKNKLFAIQGDLVIEKVDRIPSGAKKKEGRIILYGEVSTHKHQFTQDSDVQLYTLGNMQYADIHAPSRQIHEEHDEIKYEMPGLYRIRRQREYTNRDATRLVQD